MDVILQSILLREKGRRFREVVDIKSGLWKSQVVALWKDLPALSEEDIEEYDDGVVDGDSWYGEYLREPFDVTYCLTEPDLVFFANPTIMVRVAGVIAFQMAMICDGDKLANERAISTFLQVLKLKSARNQSLDLELLNPSQLSLLYQLVKEMSLIVTDLNLEAGATEALPVLKAVS
ncbi:MAG TPA: hypothetical protein VGL56_15240 [Fimbriimonadaceae bacterium]